MHTKLFEKPAMPVLIAIGSILILNACAMMTVSVETRLFCEVAKPILWSTRDTDETIKQAKAHNAVGKRLDCAKVNSEWKAYNG